MPSIEKLLDARITEQLQKLETEEDVNERKIINETIDTLYRQKLAEAENSSKKREAKNKLELEQAKIELEKSSIEAKKKELETLSAQKNLELKEAKKSRIWNTVLSVASLITGVGTSLYGLKAVLHFEETGVFTSILSKDVIKNLHFKRK